MANQTVINAEPGKHDYFVIREFDAPRELVFQAFTDPELVVKWLGPRRLKMTIEKYESKNGGAYRYVQEDTNGNQYVFSGVRVRLLEALAGHLATAIDNARMFRRERLENERMAKELEEARAIQLALFPRNAPKTRGFDVTGVCLPCRGHTATVESLLGDVAGFTAGYPPSDDVTVVTIAAA